jgi:polyisoprenoid-binding protein YceI
MTPRLRMKSLISVSALALVAIVVLSAMPPHATPEISAREIFLGVDPRRSKIQWTLGTTLHTVHGTFALKRGTLRLDPTSGKASGEIVADAKSGESGNDSRDKKMHKDVLESERYPEVIFRPDRFEGKIDPQGRSTVQVHGVFVLHGAEHELTAPVQAELSADHWAGSAKIRVPFVQWGLKNPSNFLLRVDHDVEVELELKGNLEGSSVP